MNAYVTMVLNRYSMYKVVSGSLTILFVIAVLLSAVGELSYSPLAMILSVLVLGFSVWLTSLLFGLLFGVRVHAESSFITAVILFFIVAPTATPAGLLALLLVGMIAGASKFVIAYKGRHIFNAAALAAFLASILNIAHESWWVGTPVLIFPTFVLGFLVLQKTRRVPSSGTFLGLSTLLVISMLILEGNTFSQSVVLWLSWPIFFFSSFMLSEPLTLPRKRWQQILEAIVVALLFGIPFNIGDFSTSPALALLVGNIIAFGFTRRQKIRLTFREKKKLTPTTYEFIFNPHKPQYYIAGQYLEIRVSAKKSDLRGSRRSFSITSAPGEETVRLGIKFYEPASAFKKAMRELEKGTIVDSTGISGDFTLPKDPQVPLLYVAGGIGITPFISHLQTLMQRGETRNIVLFYSISNETELAYKDILVRSGINVFVVTASSRKLTLPKGWMHINAPYVTKEIFETNVADIVERTAFISGPPAMIDGAKKQLKKLHVKQVKTDYFIGY